MSLEFGLIPIKLAGLFEHPVDYSCTITLRTITASCRTKIEFFRNLLPVLLHPETDPRLRTGRENGPGSETRALGLFITGFIERPFIHPEIVLRHSFHSKPLFEAPATSSTVDFRNMLDSRRHFVESFADESSASVLNDFRNGPTSIGQHGGSAG